MYGLLILLFQRLDETSELPQTLLPGEEFAVNSAHHPSPFAPAHDTSVPDSRSALQAPTSLPAQQGRTGQTLGLCCDWHATNLPGQKPRPCSTARTWAITRSLAAARCPGAWMARRSPEPTHRQPLTPYLALATFSATSPPPGTTPGTSWSPGGGGGSTSKVSDSESLEKDSTPVPRVQNWALPTRAPTPQPQTGSGGGQDPHRVTSATWSPHTDPSSPVTSSPTRF